MKPLFALPQGRSGVSLPLLPMTMLHGAGCLCAGLFLLLVLMLAPAQAEAQVRPVLRIGAKNFTEQLLLATLTGRFLALHGFSPVLKTGLGTVVMRQALEHDQLDLVWDYTGTALIVYHHRHEQLAGPESYDLAARLDRRHGLVWLKPSELNNAYAVVMPRHVAEQDNISTISDLAARFRAHYQDGSNNRNKAILLGTDFEFPLRPDGLPGLEKTYDFSLARQNVRSMDAGLIFLALKNRQLYAGMSYSSDGRISGFDLRALEDDRHYFSVYLAVPVIRQSVIDRYPQLADLMAALSGQLNTERMQQLNREVDIDQRPISEVVDNFMRDTGLLDPALSLSQNGRQGSAP